jgi:hypothetical protein
MDALLRSTLWFASLGPAVCQVTMQPSVLQSITLQVDNLPPAVVAPGPVGGSGFLVSSGSNGNYSQLELRPIQLTAPGSIGWSSLADIRAVAPPTATGTASLVGRIELRLSAPQPTTGVLILLPNRWNSSFGTISGDQSVDVNNDGIPDYFAGTSNPIEIPLTVGPSGWPLRIDFNLGLSVQPQPGGTTWSGMARGFRIVFAPNIYGIQDLAPACGSWFASGRTLPDLNYQFSVSSPYPQAMAWALLAVGLASSNVILPAPPGCPLLVDSPALLLPHDDSWPFTKTWTLPALPPLPLGLQVYAQVVGSHSASVFTGNLVRTF